MAFMAGYVPAAAILFALGASSAAAQTPQPFPRAGEAPTATAPAVRTAPASPAQASQPVGQLTAPVAQTAPATQADPGAPKPEDVVFAVYPAAQFLGSFDAGRSQRYFLYGTTAAFQDVVAYYRTQLSDKGDTVFREPPTHVFEVGRFREDTMAFPPGVTVKDWTWGGSQGYPNPKAAAQPARYPTVIMIVPPPAAAAAPARR
jgi:hypothetical protein